MSRHPVGDPKPVANFLAELDALLPRDLPHRDACAAGCARHLELIHEANQQFNLTRIVDARDAAIKHVLDSVLPWRHFANAGHVVDAGSGAGFPGVPLALVLPDTRFTLIESTRKKAAFIEAAAGALGLANVAVIPERAEDWLKHHRAPVITARAVAPLLRAIPLFAPALRGGARLLLYKGRDAETEIAEAATVAGRARCTARIVERYELPDDAGTRAMVEVTAAGPESTPARPRR